MLTLGSLCSGFGGLDLGLERAGFNLAWHVEPDAACSTVLDRHWPGVLNHGDLKTVDWATVEPVDAVCGGYPCQPFSHAGRRRGEDDPRHLWPFVCAAVRHLRPRLVLLENVSGHRSLGFGRVLGDLAEVGYDATWASVRASDVAAPHGRERVFILAAPADASDPALDGQRARSEPRQGGSAPADAGRLEHERRRGPGEVAGAAAEGEGGEAQRQRVRDTAGGRCAPPADHDDLGHDRARGARRRGTGPADRGRQAPAHANLSGPQGRQPAAGRLLPARCGAAVADAPGDEGRLLDRDGLSARWREYGPAIARWERAFGEPAPDPLDERGRLNVNLTRWMMGFPPGWHGDLPRTAALRGYGNAVQVQVAELVGRWATTIEAA